MVPLNLLFLKNEPIFKQLQIEEALLRSDQNNWCIINHGSPKAIVMGISCQKEKLVHLEIAKQFQLPLIRRFSGGGTVVINEQTIFTTFIFNQTAINCRPYPLEIMKWSETIFSLLFQNISFNLRDNDYTVGDKKVGGNAQSIIKNRWLHHTSFLYSYNKLLMNALKQPTKCPAYRQGRNHEDFITTLSHWWKTPDEFCNDLIDILKRQFRLEKADKPLVELALSKDHRRALKIEA